MQWWPRSWVRAVARVSLIGVILFLVSCLSTVAFQDRLIFFPRSYGEAFKAGTPWREQLSFETAQGRQHAYWAPAPGLTADALPDRVWILSGGNGTLAKELGFLVEATWEQNPRVAFLALEYPGYGDNAGRPSRESIREASDAAVESLASRLKTTRQTLLARMSCCGHSLGAAVALENAARWDLREVVAVSPFTSLKDMARLRVGSLAAAFLRHPYDNRTSLAQLAKSGARVWLYHGTEDGLIPVRMARELRDAHPDCATLMEVPGADHNDVLWESQNDLAKILSAKR